MRVMLCAIALALVGTSGTILAKEDVTFGERTGQILGKVDRIDGMIYRITDFTGIEYTMKLDRATRKKGNVQVGSKVSVTLSGGRVAELAQLRDVWPQ